jgi:hypothetical protein
MRIVYCQSVMLFCFSEEANCTCNSKKSLNAKNSILLQLLRIKF